MKALLFACYLCLFSPQQSVETMTTPTIQVEQITNDKVNPYDNVGEEHNEMLGMYYRMVYARTGEFNIEQTTFFFKELGLGDLVNKGYNMNEIVESSPSEFLRNLQGKTKLSSASVDFLKKTYSAIRSKRPLETMASLEQSVKNSLLNEREQMIVFSALSVGKHSYTYWNENLNKWIKGDDQIFAKAGADIVEADVSGAISGAVVAGLTGGTGSGAIVAGAAGASVAKAVSTGAKAVFKAIGKNTGWW